MTREIEIHGVKFDVIASHECGTRRILEIGRPGLQRIVYATEFANGTIKLNA